MTFLSACLIAISAFLHAGWNLMGKRGSPGTLFFFMANTLGVIFLLPFFLTVSAAVKCIPREVWGLLLLTGLFQAVYLFGLASAYRSGELSLVYPTVRAVPVLLVTLILVLWSEELFSVLYFSGVALIVLGLFVIYLWGRRGRPPAGIRFSAPTLVFVMVAALGSSGYTLVDSLAMGRLISLDHFTPVNTPLIYIVLQGIFASLWLSVLVFSQAEVRRFFWPALKKDVKKAFQMGAIMYLNYGFVLASMIFAENVGYIVAFRQLCIPIGIVFGGLILKEKIGLFRVLGTLVIFAGLILVGIG